MEGLDEQITDLSPGFREREREAAKAVLAELVPPGQGARAQ